MPGNLKRKIDQEKMKRRIKRKVQAFNLELTLQRRAGRAILAFWRENYENSTIFIMKRFCGYKLNTTAIRSMSFENVSAKLSNPGLKHACNMVWKRIVWYCIKLFGRPDNLPISLEINWRYFSAIYLLISDPQKAFRDTNAQTDRIIRYANVLIKYFEIIVKQFIARNKKLYLVEKNLFKNIREKIGEYHRAFHEWKVSDSASVVMRLQTGLFSLYDSEKNLVASNVSNKEQLLAETRERITKTRDTLRRIGGLKALEDFDTQRAAQLDKALSSPAPTMTLSNMRAVIGKMNNDQMMHELVFDSRFQFEHLAEHTDSNTHDMLWKCLVSDLCKDPPAYSSIWRLLEAVKTNILASSTSRVTVRMADVMDIEFLKTRQVSGAFSYDDSMGMCLDVFSCIEESRDKDKHDQMRKSFQKLRSSMEMAMSSADRSTAFIDMLKFLYDQSLQINLDACNKRLRSIAPCIFTHGHEYETEKFEKAFESKSITLEKTAAFIVSATERALHSKYACIENLREGSATEYKKIIYSGFCHMLHNFEKERIPETFRFDVARLELVADSFDSVASIFCIVAGLKSRTASVLIEEANQDARTQEYVQNCTTVANRLSEVIGIKLKDCTKANFAQMFKLYASEEFSVIALDAEIQDRLMKDVMFDAACGSPVHKLFKSRIVQAWLKIFSKGTMPDEDKRNLKLGHFLINRIIHSCDVARRVVDISMRIHSEYYNKLIASAAEQIAKSRA